MLCTDVRLSLDVIKSEVIHPLPIYRNTRQFGALLPFHWGKRRCHGESGSAGTIEAERESKGRGPGWSAPCCDYQHSHLLHQQAFPYLRHLGCLPASFPLQLSLAPATNV